MEARFSEPIVAGDRAAVEWWAVVEAVDGSAETLVGISLISFDRDGLVREQRDVWTSTPGPVEPAWWRE